MKVELHLHTNRYSACSVASPEALMERLIQADYGAVFITEHDALWEPAELAELRAEFPRLRIFPGVELSFADGSLHLLVLGASDPAYLGLPDARAAILRARQEGHLTVLAHPFRGGWDISQACLLLEGPALPDAMEQFTNNQEAPQAMLAAKAAARLNLAPLNAGDVHSLEAVGRYWVETARPLELADDIREVVLARQYENQPGGRRT